MNLTRILLSVFAVGTAVVATAHAQSDSYEIETDPSDSGYTGSTSIEMKKRYDYDYSSKYRGEIDEDGSVRMKNSDGDRLRGYIDEDGYGKLRDDDGNVYRVKPR